MSNLTQILLKNFLIHIIERNTSDFPIEFKVNENSGLIPDFE